jgi:hypothetical protein
MLDIDHLLDVADAYKRALRLEDVTVSHRLFGDSKKLGALRQGADITLGRFNASLQWLSAHWPDEAEWPRHVARPFVEHVEVPAPRE